MSFDLTNKNISDTFQSVLQRTGSDNSLYTLDGTLVEDLRISGSLIAQQYIVSSSVINTQIVTNSGSTQFGNDTGDNHHFTGSIRTNDIFYTANGHIREDPVGTLDINIGSAATAINLNTLDELSAGWTGLIVTQSRVGIGTDSPESTLHVIGKISASAPLEYNADIGTNMVFTSTGSSNATADSVPVNRVAINVPREDISGLGSELTVSGSISASGDLYIGNAGSWAVRNIFMDGLTNRIHFNSGSGADDISLLTSQIVSGRLTLYSGSSATHNLHDTKTGYVGFGNVTPTKMLTVEGDISASKDIYQKAGRGTIYGHETNFDYRLFGSALGGVIIKSGSSYDVMRISASNSQARVNIGTSNNSGKELTVSGSISASGNLHLKANGKINHDLADNMYIAFNGTSDIGFHNGDVISNMAVYPGTVTIGTAAHIGGTDVDFQVNSSNIGGVNEGGILMVDASEDKVKVGPAFSDSMFTVVGNTVLSGSVAIGLSTDPLISQSVDGLTVHGDISASGHFYSAHQTQIKIRPNDFIPNDDALVAVAVVEDDGSNFGVKVTTATSELYAYIDVPLGFTATKVKINGSDSANDVEVYTYDMDDGTISSEISNTGLDVNDDLDLASNHVGANDKLLLIKIVVTNTDDLIYGGYVTIKPT